MRHIYHIRKLDDVRHTYHVRIVGGVDMRTVGKQAVQGASAAIKKVGFCEAHLEY